jgi:hypothetical protein
MNFHKIVQLGSKLNVYYWTSRLVCYWSSTNVGIQIMSGPLPLLLISLYWVIPYLCELVSKSRSVGVKKCTLLNQKVWRGLCTKMSNSDSTSIVKISDIGTHSNIVCVGGSNQAPKALRVLRYCSHITSSLFKMKARRDSREQNHLSYIVI